MFANRTGHCLYIRGPSIAWNYRVRPIIAVNLRRDNLQLGQADADSYRLLGTACNSADQTMRPRSKSPWLHLLPSSAPSAWLKSGI